MLNDFTGGGQIFLHKLRMFFQVLNRSFTTAFLVSIVIVGIISYRAVQDLDCSAAITYQKALLADGFDDAFAGIRAAINPKAKHNFTRIDAYDKKGLYANAVDPRKIINSDFFRTNYLDFWAFLKIRLFMIGGVMLGIFLLIYIIWSRFGREVKEEKHISGATIKTAKEVAKYLKATNKASSLKIGDMPLVKDSETRHILITGTTGSGKTNLVNNILPLLVKDGIPALVVDQTGEMIAKYYDPNRGDIIFNPLDNRGLAWDFWTDNKDESGSGKVSSRLEKFAKILFKYGKKPYSGGDPFWDNSAEVIFCACVEYLINTENESLEELQHMLNIMSPSQLALRLSRTMASRYFGSHDKNTSNSVVNSSTLGSILSVMATNTRPLNLLTDSEEKFSLKEYFQAVNKGSSAWLFLASAPDLREVTAPLISCLFELAISYLVGIGIKEDRRMWFVIDELASLGRLSGLPTLMLEGRKYGACVLAATQSINQLFENFGKYGGSSIFGQFATKFMFRNDEPSSCKIISDIFGNLEYSHQQKNTSFGANEFRDGISYTEQQRHKSLISGEDLASLSDHECFVGLPEPKVRLAKIKVPLAKNVSNKSEGFVPILHSA